MFELKKVKGMDPKEFRSEFVAKRKPVIIEDATKNWRALQD